MIMMNSKRIIDYVLVYEHLDYGSEDSKKKSIMENLRQLFATFMSQESLETEEERVGKHVFVKVYCSMERLYQEAETIMLDLPLRGMVIVDPVKKEAMIEMKMKRFLNVGEIDHNVTAPFQKNCLEWFTGKMDPDSLFTSALRRLLVYNILINIDISKCRESGNIELKQGLSYLLMVGAYKDAFVLHDPSSIEPVSMPKRPQSEVLVSDSVESSSQFFPPKEPSDDPRQLLNEEWGRMCRSQPIHPIRDYFGEKIAFYFAWVGTFISSLWIPMILGLVVFFFGVFQKYNTSEKKGPLYYVEVIKSSSDNILTPAFAFIVCLWGTIFMEVWKRKQISYAYQWHVENFDNVEPDRPQFYGTKMEVDPLTSQQVRVKVYPMRNRMMKYFTSTAVLLLMVCLVFISVTSVILYRVYMTVSYCEPGDGMCDLLHGTILATFLNTISIMILGKIYEYIAVKLTDWENHQTLSEYNDALVIKLFAFQFANTYTSLFYTAFFRRDIGGVGILGAGRQYTDNCGAAENANCMSLLSFQLLVLMVVKPFPKFFKDVVFPFIKKTLRRCGLNEITDVTTDEGESKQHYLLREMLKPSAEDFRLSEFTEKIIQYGYLMLFAASFPLAPLFALIFNLVDLRIDAKRLLLWDRRPVPYRDNDIGIWFNIINFINVCGVISNAFLIGMTSEIGRAQSMEMQFAIIIGFEHLVFFVKFILATSIPDVPTWVKNSQKKEQFMISKLLSKASTVKQHKPNCPKANFDRSAAPASNDGKERNSMPCFQSTAEPANGEALPKSRWSYG